MKTLALTLILAVSLALAACNKPTTPVASANPAVAVETAAPAPSSHLCGAPTKKAGKTCTRKVSNGDGTDSAVQTRCFQHR